MRRNLNQKTLVSQEYCTGFVDCRYTNLWTSYHNVSTTGYWKRLVGGGGNTEGGKLILLLTVQSMHLMCTKKSIVTPD